MTLKKQINKRRTFAIISHPDAGKTTLTEKLLLYGGAIQLAGSVKAKRSKKFATSDWMELEKKRGISVTSSVMNFSYKECEMNLIDTPGHQDFSEDTYRTLTAVDSALMLIDAANGVEEQTKKLFKICHSRRTPIMTFINKLDRPGHDPFTLLEEIEKVLGIQTYPVTWPIGMGEDFRGVYNRSTKEVILYDKDEKAQSSQAIRGKKLELSDLRDLVGEEIASNVMDELELLEEAGNQYDEKAYIEGKLAPVFFGSALNNFGTDILLDYVISLAPSPQPRKATQRLVEPEESKFSGVIFKIQANMDPSHRDRVAFVRICSGEFNRGMKSYHVRLKRQMRLGRPTQFLAQDRSLVDQAYPGDIVGIHDPGLFKIGDTITEGESLNYTGVPVFAPEHFYRVDLDDPLRSKQLRKGLTQLSEEGAVQLFNPLTRSDYIIGVVGALQVDVVKYRIEAEYGVKVKVVALPFQAARWLESSDKNDLDHFIEQESQSMCLDLYGNHALLVDYDWRVKILEERNPAITFHATCEGEISSQSS